MRIAIIGNAAGGKSRLARALAQRHDLQLLELDSLIWKPGWVRTPKAELEARHEDWIERPDWIIDGVGPWALALKRLAIADKVVFVDLPFRVHLWWACKRQITSLFKARLDGPKDCPMWKKTPALFQMMFWLDRELRPKILSELSGRSDVVRLKSVSELNDFYSDQTGINAQ